jgi:hypothetical protein
MGPQGRLSLAVESFPKDRLVFGPGLTVRQYLSFLYSRKSYVKQCQHAISEEEAKRDFCQRPKETFRAYMLRGATNFAARLKAAGLPVKVNQAGQYKKPGKTGSDSVYLKREKMDFDVRIADHKPDKGIKSERPTGPRYFLAVEKDAGGRGRISTADLNDTLYKIITRHGK